MNRPLLVVATILVFSLGVVNARAMTPDAQAAYATFNRQVEMAMPVAPVGDERVAVAFAAPEPSKAQAAPIASVGAGFAGFLLTAIALIVGSLALGLASVGLKAVWMCEQTDLIEHDPLLGRSDA
jgi:hypothetical protein